MKKFVLAFLFAFVTVISVSAQTATVNSKALDNISLGVFGGVNTPLSFNDGVFPLNTTAGIRLGKDVTPVLGFNVEGSAWFNDNGTFHVHGNTPAYLLNHFAGKTFVKGVTVGGNATLNLSNMFFGYKGKPRVFETSAIGGLAWGHVYTREGANAYTTSLANDDDELLAKTGVDLTFNIGHKRAWQIYIEPSVVWNLTGGNLTNTDAGTRFNKNHAYAQVQVGLNYRFKNSNGTHYFKTVDLGAMNAEINELREAASKIPNEVVRTVENTDTVYSTSWVVYFYQNMSDLTEDAKAELDKIPANVKVAVVGHASVEGSEPYNQTLSEKRAEAVKAYLESKGITVVSATGEGETGYPKNRVAIVSISE